MKRKITLKELEDLYRSLVSDKKINSNRPDPLLLSPRLFPQVIKDTDSAIKYKGIWNKREHRLYHQGTSHSSSSKYSSLSLKFQGTSIQYWGAYGPARGKAEVYLNGALVDQLDLYSKKFQPKQLLGSYQVPWGTHLIKIVVLREKNPLSMGYRVDFDNFKIL